MPSLKSLAWVSARLRQVFGLHPVSQASQAFRLRQVRANQGGSNRVVHSKVVRSNRVVHPKVVRSNQVVHSNQAGSVLVEWSLVAVLVMAVTAALLQLTLSLYVRNILADAASDAARHAALVGASDAEANARVQQLCHGALRANYPTKSEVSHLQRGSVSLVQVQVSAPLPVIGLWSPTGSVVVRGHAVDQRSYQR